MTQELLAIQQSQGQVKYDKERVQAALKAEEARLDALVEADAVLTDLEQLRERAVKTKVSGAVGACGIWACKKLCETKTEESGPFTRSPFYPLAWQAPRDGKAKGTGVVSQALALSCGTFIQVGPQALASSQAALQAVLQSLS